MAQDADKPKPMQKAGEICSSCLPHWEKRKDKGQILIRLPKTTQNKKMFVVVCKFCDGPALRFSKLAEQREKEEKDESGTD